MAQTKPFLSAAKRSNPTTSAEAIQYRTLDRGHPQPIVSV